MEVDAITIAGEMLAGLGLIFIGIQHLSGHLREMTGRKFRMMIKGATRSPFISAAAGALLGATMQTGSAITFILVSMVSAGMITVDRSLPVRLGAAVGTSTMVFVATLDIQLFILFLLGVSGVLIAQLRSPKPILGVFFGGGLMFFGLQMVGGSASALTDLAWFHDMIIGVDHVPLAAFLLGAVLSIIVQSPQSVAILAIALTGAEVLNSWTTIAIIYGSNFGGGLSTYLLSAGFKGTSRQIMIFQTLFNVLTGSVLLLLFYAERLSGAPLVHALVMSLALPLEQQLAVVYLIFNVFGAVMMFVLRRPILDWIEKRWPPSAEEEIARLRFLKDHVMDEPALALELAEKEQLRFVGLLQDNIDAVRLEEDDEGAARSDPAEVLSCLHEALENALKELSYRVGVGGSEQMISLANRNQILGSLQQSLAEFCDSVRAIRNSEALAPLGSIFLESVDALLGVTIDGVQSGKRADLEQIWQASHSRSEQMRKVRARSLAGDTALAEDERLDLISLTNGLERTIWLLHEYIGELRERAEQDHSHVAPT